MIKKFLFSIISLVALLFAKSVLAHCPLCTVGAGILAGLAAYLGINSMTIGLFIGAFALALGMWFSKFIRKKFIPYQKAALSLVSYLSIVLPLLPLVKDYTSVSLFFAGDYGSLLNRTYLINKFLLGSLIGVVIMIISPFFSKKISKILGSRVLPYQGIILTFSLLLIISVIIELLT